MHGSADTCTFLILGPDFLEYLLLVIGDHIIGGIDDDLGGTVILLQFRNAVIGIIGPEVQNILDVGPAKCINTLRIISHDADILVVGSKLLNDQVLRIVGVLVLIDEDITEICAGIYTEHRGNPAEERSC